MPNPTESAAPELSLELLKLVGETVYGDFWRKPMAAYLGMSQRQMIRWAQGEWIVPDVLADGRYLMVVLMELLDEHITGVARVRQQLVSALPEGGRPGT